MLIDLPNLFVTGDEIAVTVSINGAAAPRLGRAQVTALRDALTAWLDREAPR